MEFEMIDDGPTGAQDVEILRGIEIREFTREDFTDLAAEELPLVLEPGAFDEGLIDSQVTSLSVFDEEGSFGNVIEQLFNDGQLGRDGRRVKNYLAVG